MSTLYNNEMQDSEYLKRIGTKLRILRSLKNYSQDYIANKLGIDKSYYSKVERGITNPTLLYIKHLAEVFDVSVSDLVDAKINF